MNARTRRAVIVCIGNYLLRDDGIGVHVAQKLSGIELPEGVEVIEVGTSLFFLSPLLEEARYLLFIDAVEKGRAPGSIHVLDAEEMSSPGAKKSTVHELGLFDTLDVIKLKGQPLPEMCMIGVEPEKTDVGTELSSPVEKAIPEVVQKIKDVLSNWGYN